MSAPRLEPEPKVTMCFLTNMLPCPSLGFRTRKPSKEEERISAGRSEKNPLSMSAPEPFLFQFNSTSGRQPGSGVGCGLWRPQEMEEESLSSRQSRLVSALQNTALRAGAVVCSCHRLHSFSHSLIRATGVLPGPIAPVEGRQLLNPCLPRRGDR